MKQTLLVTALALMASSANATDFNQYISAKVARTRMQNDAFADFSLDLASSAIMRGTIADKTLKDNVWGARIAYGLEKPLPSLSSKIRAEVEYGMNESAKKSGNFDFQYGTVVTTAQGNFNYKSTIQTVMLNAYYDYQLNDIFSPYLGAGIGYAHVKIKADVYMPLEMWSTSYSEQAKDTEGNFAWNISLGTGVKVTDSVSADLGYRYTNYGHIKKTNETGRSRYKLDSHEIYLGMRYSF